MIKNIILLLGVMLVRLTAFGQDASEMTEGDSLELAPPKYGITIQLNSLNYDDINVGWFNVYNGSLDDHNLRHNSVSIGAIFNYNLNKETTLRLRLAATQISMEEYYDFTDDQGIFNDFSAVGQQGRFQIAPGIIWKFKPSRLEFYGGFELPVNLHGEFQLTEKRMQFASGGGNTMSHSILNTTLPKGFTAGIGAVGGFNYFINRNFSLGAEFSSALLYAKLSGETTAILTTVKPENRPPVIVNTRDENRGMTFNDNRFSISVSYWFSD